MRRALKLWLAGGALVLAGCGAEVDAEERDGSPAAQASAAGHDTPERDIIPAAFQGEWSSQYSDACAPGEQRMLVRGNATGWDNHPLGEVIDARVIDARTVELVGAPDPEYPDADQRFGLSLGEDGDTLTMHAPGASSMTLIRCDAASAAATPAAVARPTAGLSELPERFLGSWDVEYEFRCDEESDSRMRITPRRIQYWESQHDLSDFRRIDADTIEVSAVLTHLGEEVATETLQLQLQESGRWLSTIQNGEEVWRVRKCP